MTKTWALGLLKKGYYTTNTSVPFAPLTEKEAHQAALSFLALYKTGDNIPPEVSLVIRRVVQNVTDPITRFQWVSAYANIMHGRIIGECNIDYCNDCATSSMAALGSGEWMCVTPADAVQGEMECWDD